jgi:hypothetical protein
VVSGKVHEGGAHSDSVTLVKGRQRLQRWCAAAFPVGEQWPTVSIGLIHHEEEEKKGEVLRRRVGKPCRSAPAVIFKGAAA